MDLGTKRPKVNGGGFLEVGYLSWTPVDGCDRGISKARGRDSGIL